MSCLGDSMIADEARSELLRFLAPAVVVLNVGPTRREES